MGKEVCTKWIWITAVVVFGMASLSDSGEGGPDGEVKEQIDALVAKAVTGPRNEDNGDPSLAWAVFLRDMEDEVLALFEGKATLPNVAYYWSQFGQHGCVADYALVAAAPGMMHPGTGSLFSGRWNGEEKKEQFPAIYRLHILGSEVQARSLLGDRNKLERYHRMILWSHLVYRRTDQHDISVTHMAQQIKALFADEDNDDKYWWAARNFVLLAYATGRDDLLEGAEADDLRSRFAQWYEWLEDKSAWLEPNPETWRWEISEQRQPFQGIPLPDDACGDWEDNVPMPDARKVANMFI